MKTTESRGFPRRAILSILLVGIAAAACTFLAFPSGAPRSALLTPPGMPTPSATYMATITPRPEGDTQWERIPTPEAEQLTPIPQPVENIALDEELQVLVLLGSDTESPYVGRTDAILVVFYHPRLARASLLSLPPDLFVYLPGHGMQRLNTAYALGGYELLSLTLEYNLGIRPDRFALVHMNEFASFVNELGGVYMDVLRPYQTPWGVLAPGNVFMTGEQLLFFSTLRDGVNGEPDRNIRQQEIFRILFLRLVEGGNLVRLPMLIENYRESVETNLSPFELIEFVPLALRLGDPGRIGFFTLTDGETTPWEIPGELPVTVFLPQTDDIRLIIENAIAFACQAEPLTDVYLTLEYELTISPTASLTPTSTITLTPTNTLTRTITPISTITRTRTVTRTRTPTRTITPTSTITATATATPDYVAFSADYNSDTYLDLLIMNADGSNVSTLLVNSSENLLCDWNTGRMLLVYESVQTSRQLYLINIDGSGQTLIPNLPDGENSQAAFSPDGQWLVFRNENAGQGDLFIIDIDGNNLRRLTNDAVDDYHPEWSADQNSVIFVTERDGNPELYRIATSDLGLLRLTNTGGAEAYPRLSPNGFLLVYAYEDSGQWDLYTSSPGDLSSPQHLTDDTALESEPAWVWNSQSILFIRDGEIYSVQYDGSNLTQVNNSLGSERRPVGMP